jgi:hypothetical protein
MFNSLDHHGNFKKSSAGVQLLSLRGASLFSFQASILNESGSNRKSPQQFGNMKEKLTTNP